MGVVNVTPDSFSDGGRFFDPKAAIAHARALIDDGADILDVGGESSRPGAAPVSRARRSCARILPVLEKLARRRADLRRHAPPGGDARRRSTPAHR